MTLSERIVARAICAVTGCPETRVTDSLFCRDHLSDMWANRLDKTPTGYVPRRTFRPRDETRLA